nr:hypothetical protein GCM10025732_50850 [Glycomyces mayteni]
MTFQTRARRVRNPDLPMGQRYTALRCALEEYRQIGFHASWAFLTGTDGRAELDAETLVRALDRLEASRNARIAENAVFARRRAEAKRAGRREPEAEEARYRRGRRWPGPDALEASRFAVAFEWRRIGPGARDRLAPLHRHLEQVVAAFLDGPFDRAERQLLAQMSGDLAAIRRELHDLGLRSPALNAWRVQEIISLDTFPLVRRGWGGDVEDVARIFWATRSGMAYLPALYTREQTDWWVREVMVPQSEVLVAEHRGVPVGFAALEETCWRTCTSSRARRAAGSGRRCWTGQSGGGEHWTCGCSRRTPGRALSTRGTGSVRSTPTTGRGTRRACRTCSCGGAAERPRRRGRPT